MTVLRFLFSEICTVAAGLGVATFLLPRRPVAWIERMGLALILGSGAISIMLFVLGGILQGGALVAGVASIALILGVAGLFGCVIPDFRDQISFVAGILSRRSYVSWRNRQWGVLPGSGLFLAVLVPVLFFAGWQAANHPLTADGLFNFEIRAQLAALHGGRVPAAFFADPSRTWTHPAYPLFLPLNQTWIYLCAGGPHQGLGQLLGVHFLAGAACLLFASVARLTGDAWRGGLASAMLFLLPSAMLIPGSALSLWADFPLAVVFLSGVIYLLEFEATGLGLSLFSAFLALLPWVKREGLVLAGVLACALCWVAWRRGKLRQIPAALFPLAVTVLGWKIFLTAVHASPDEDFLPLSIASAIKHADHVPFAVVSLARELIVWDRWSLLWPLAALAILRIARDPALKRWRLLAPIIATLFALYSSIYVFSAWPTLALHIFTSLPRLLLPVAMPAILAIAAAVPGWEREQRSDVTASGGK